MIFTGRQLKDLGCPSERIKFFVDKEFDSQEQLLESIANWKNPKSKTDEEKELDRILREDPDCAFNILLELNCFPWSIQSNSFQPSKREVRQWLEQGAVRINGKFPKPQDFVEFPISDLVFFPQAKRQTTLR